MLVVDDDSDGAEAAGKLLETFGCNVSLVVSAGEALERIEEGADVDLVFSDVVMPDIDGLEFAERLHELRPGLPVIFCTGYTSAVEALTDCGAMALMKPYSADVLERVVAERLQLARDARASPARQPSPSATDRAASAAYTTDARRADSLSSIFSCHTSLLLACSNGISASRPVLPMLRSR